VAEEARRLSRAPRAEDLARERGSKTRGMYGVAVVVTGEGPPYAELLYGASAASTCVNYDTNQPLLRKYLNPNVIPYTGATTTGTGRRTYTMMQSGRVHWFYSHGGGRVVDYTPTGDGLPREVGTGDRLGLNLVKSANTVNTSAALASASPRPAEFGVVLLDQSYAVGLAFFHIGLGFSREIPAVMTGR
jgi:hypothetical protein